MSNNSIYQYSNGEFLTESLQPYPSRRVKFIQHKSTRYMNVNGDNNEKLPELYEKREECCGCSACFAICPLSGEKRPEKARKSVGGKPYKITYQFGNSGTFSDYEHTGAITMLPDEEGFLYPVIDAEICIRCYKCLDVCAFKQDMKEKSVSI